MIATSVATAAGRERRQDTARPVDGVGLGPVRTCIGCRRRAPVANLVRTVVRDDGGLALDRTASGRGAWICRSPRSGAGQVACIDLAARRSAFTRALRAPVSGAAIGALRAMASERARIDNGAAVNVVPSGRD
jgi:predicted RNA-binding protein YlxR (DUF448 family)